MSDAHKGKKHTEETKRKISEAKKDRRNQESNNLAWRVYILIS